MAERRGLAPQSRKLGIDLFSKQSQPAGLVDAPFNGAPGQIRTDTERILSPLPSAVGLRERNGTA